MKIHFTKKEYTTLLEMVQIAGWVLHAHRTDDPVDRQPHGELEEKILSLAKEFGCGDDIVQFDEKLKAHFLTRQFEDNVMPFIEEHDEDTFWNELTNRLVVRDVMREVGAAKYQAFDIEERIRKELPYEQKYDNEFAEHGLERLEIVAGPLTMGHN